MQPHFHLSLWARYVTSNSLIFSIQGCSGAAYRVCCSFFMHSVITTALHLLLGLNLSAWKREVIKTQRGWVEFPCRIKLLMRRVCAAAAAMCTNKKPLFIPIGVELNLKSLNLLWGRSELTNSSTFSAAERYFLPLWGAINKISPVTCWKLSSHLFPHTHSLQTHFAFRPLVLFQFSLVLIGCHASDLRPRKDVW